MNIRQYFDTLATTAEGMNPAPVIELSEAIIRTQGHNNRVFICGNGGSAATADHFTLDLQKNIPGGLACISLSSTATITAYANDHAYSEIYSSQLSRLCQPGDMLIAISTSGNSQNIINAVLYAKSHLLKVVTMTAGSGGDLLNLGHIKIHTETDNIGIAEDIHAAALHSVIEHLRTKGGGGYENGRYHHQGQPTGHAGQPCQDPGGHDNQNRSII